jgi:membrane-bound serine protease (ClpP class)
VFFVAELFLPSFGVLGFGGLVAVTLGSLFLYTPESSLYVDRSLVVATVAVFGSVMALILGLLVRDRSRRAATGEDGLIGKIGITVSEIPVRAAGGRVRVHGEYWNATSEVAIAKDRRVEVTAVRGLEIEVRPVQE